MECILFLLLSSQIYGEDHVLNVVYLLLHLHVSRETNVRKDSFNYFASKNRDRSADGGRERKKKFIGPKLASISLLQSIHFV